MQDMTVDSQNIKDKRQALFMFTGRPQEINKNIDTQCGCGQFKMTT